MSSKSLKYANNQQRLVWIDIAKGIGIFLMVFAHTARGLVASSLLSESAIAFVDRWIYAFHMPLFFFVSGLLAQRMLRSQTLPWANKMLRTIVYPYFLWSILQTLLQMAASNSVNREMSATQLWAIVYQPVQQFWFLYALLMVMVAYFVSRKLGASNGVFLAISIVLCLCQVWAIDFGGWGMLYVFRRYTIYFALGAAIGRESISLAIEKITAVGLTSVCLLLFGLVTVAAYEDWGANTWAFPLVAVCGIMGTIALAAIAQELRTTILADWGKMTLEIYLVHTIASAVVRLVLQKAGIDHPVVHLGLGTITGLYIPIWMVKYGHKLRLRYMFAIPQGSIG